MLTEDYIKNTPIFADLTEEDQRAISKRLRLENYNPDETLFAKDGASDALYLVKEGWVKLSADHASPVMANLGPGSLIGEMDFFLGRVHTMTARAAGSVVVWALDNTAMTGIIAERPEIALRLGLSLGIVIVQAQKPLADSLAHNLLLHDLSDRERGIIARHLVPRRYELGAAIYRSGDPATGLFFVEQGTVRLLGDTEEDYTELGRGEAFGEMAVLSGKPHSNTAQAASEVVLWQLSRPDFTALTETNPSIKTTLSRNLRARLTSTDQVYAMAILQRIPLFKDLPRDALTDTARLLLLRHVPAGEIIFSQGDLGDAMYIVDSGRIDAMAEEPGKAGELVGRFADGDFVGESALLTGKTRTFTAYAAADCNLWCLYRTDFDNLLIKYPQLSVALSRALRERLNSSEDYAVEPHLKKLALLGGLSRLQLDELSARLQPRRYQAGSTICGEGRPGEEMYFIESGQVEHWATTMQGPLLLEVLEPGDFFGEIALLSGKGHPGTAYALVDTYIWALTKADFDNFVLRFPSLSVIFSRILSERLEATMNRLRGMAPQRSLPPGPASQPVTVTPMPGSAPWRPASGPQPPVAPPPFGLRPAAGMPPVPLHRVTPPAPPGPPRPALPPVSRPMSPVPPFGSRPLRPAGPPPSGLAGPSQFTQPMPPVPPSRPGPHSQFTQAMPPVPPRPADSRSVKRRKGESKPGQKVAKPPRPRMETGGPGVSKSQAKTEARTGQPEPKRPRRQEVPRLPQPGGPARRVEAGSEAAPALKQLGPGELKRRQSEAMQPRVVSNRRLQRYNESFSVWFANRSRGAKLRILAVILIIIWLCGIMAPAWIIQALAASFEDNGAMPGDKRSIVNQVREEGAVGAVAVLPFVETATPTPTETSTPTETPTDMPTPTETPIPTWTPTPTDTPTPTNTPTPVDTPTTTPTATRALPIATRPPTDTPTPEATPTPDVDFVLKSVRQLTPCENRGKHHIFVHVIDPSGQGINGVPVKIQWAATADGFVTPKTETKQNLQGTLEPGHIDFAMFKGTYSVEIQGGTSMIASGITPDFGTNETCGEDTNANSLYHLSFEVVFQRTF